MAKTRTAAPEDTEPVEKPVPGTRVQDDQGRVTIVPGLEPEE